MSLIQDDNIECAVYQTYADSAALITATGFIPNTHLQEGINCTVVQFCNYYKI